MWMSVCLPRPEHRPGPLDQRRVGFGAAQVSRRVSDGCPLILEEFSSPAHHCRQGGKTLKRVLQEQYKKGLRPLPLGAGLLPPESRVGLALPVRGRAVS